jgi:AcrR family transcriptional regulator
MTSSSLLEGGRTQQKLRTRNALLAAARELMAKGQTPTVEDAATAAAISRTTAYRYFRNQGELLAAAHPDFVRPSILPAGAPTDVGERLDLVVKEMLRIVVEREAQYRTMLRLSLDEATRPEDLPLRQGRAIKWIEEAL